jgi:hypothetical protein
MGKVNQRFGVRVCHQNARVPNFRNTILFLSRQPWATNLTPIPATVIDKGILKNVPYSSFHCGEDYEVNVYGDLQHPAGIEIGIYRKLIENLSAKTNCLQFMRDLLSDTADKDVVFNLNLKSDYKLRDDLTFEVTPPTESDSYNGWWVSVYSESQLHLARASDEEMKHISVSKSDTLKGSDNTNNQSGWSASDLKSARLSAPKTITFINKSGTLITNAEVVRVIDGVSLIYRNGPTSGGLIRLADLPEELRKEFGYDPAKTAAADALAASQNAQWRQQMQAAQQAQIDSYSSAYVLPDYSGGYSSGGYSSGGGSVYVHGYERSNGTYVNGYYRTR